MAAVGIWRTIFELKDQLPWQSHQITVITLVWIALQLELMLMKNMVLAWSEMLYVYKHLMPM